jgi:hypothetical protein
MEVALTQQMVREEALLVGATTTTMTEAMAAEVLEY